MNMDEMNFSVAMCVYKNDNPEWVAIAIDSIINQTNQPQEIVVVVDGPIFDDLDSVIKKYEELSFFKVVRLEQNQGHGGARRIGLENCSNDLVALMDADDISAPTRFEKQLEKFREDRDLSIVGGTITEFIGEPENIIGKRVVPLEDRDIKRYMKKRCPMNQVTVMFKKSHVEEAGGYIDWYCDEDYYLWLRMSLRDMKFANLPDILVNVRGGAGMYRRRGGWKYFKSEVRLQKFMLKNRIIGFGRYMINVCERFLIQVLMPSKLRGFMFEKFAREKVKKQCSKEQ